MKPPGTLDRIASVRSTYGPAVVICHFVFVLVWKNDRRVTKVKCMLGLSIHTLFILACFVLS